MCKQRVTLKNGVDLPLVSGNTIDFFTLKDNVSAVGFQKSAYDSERGCLSASGRSEKRNEFFVSDVKIEIFQYLLAVKRDRYVFQIDNDVFQLCSPSLCPL